MSKLLAITALLVLLVVGKCVSECQVKLMILLNKCEESKEATTEQSLLCRC